MSDRSLFRLALWATIPLAASVCIIVVNALTPALSAPVPKPMYITERLSCTMLSGNVLVCEVMDTRQYADAHTVYVAPIQPIAATRVIAEQIAESCRKGYERHAEKFRDEKKFVTDCYSDLSAMAFKETRFHPDAHGDIGIGTGSFGIVQINQHFHPGTKDCALNVPCAVGMAIDRLVRYGWPAQRTRAIQCWNGCTANNGYADDVKRMAAYYK